MSTAPGAELVKCKECRDCGVEYLQIDGQPAPWSATAQKALGLTSGEAGQLFDGFNDIANVRSIAEQIAARVGERL